MRGVRVRDFVYFFFYYIFRDIITRGESQGERDIEIDRKIQINRQIDGQIDRQIDRKIDRQMQKISRSFCSCYRTRSASRAGGSTSRRASRFGPDQLCPSIGRLFTGCSLNNVFFSFKFGVFSGLCLRSARVNQAVRGSFIMLLNYVCQSVVREQVGFLVGWIDRERDTVIPIFS